MQRYHLLFISLLFSASAFSQSILRTKFAVANITVNNTASLSNKSGYYIWTVFVQADDVTLNTIDHVEYLLPPSSSRPQVSSYNRSTGFDYSSISWGEFEIKAKIIFKNTQTIQYLTYWLRLQSKIAKPVIKTIKPVYKTK